MDEKLVLVHFHLGFQLIDLSKRKSFFVPDSAQSVRN